jgi:hypothetical protein
MSARAKFPASKHAWRTTIICPAAQHMQQPIAPTPLGGLLDSIMWQGTIKALMLPKHVNLPSAIAVAIHPSCIFGYRIKLWKKVAEHNLSMEPTHPPFAGTCSSPIPSNI